MVMDNNKVYNLEVSHSMQKDMYRKLIPPKTFFSSAIKIWNNQKFSEINTPNNQQYFRS